MSDADFDHLADDLQAWTRDHDPHVRAAVELLIWHETWLRRADFRQAAVAIGRHRGGTWIRWSGAREFFEAGPRGSSSELAVLDLAVALGEDRYRLSIMGSAHSKALGRTFYAACGLGEMAT